MSWSFVGYGLARSAKQLGHEVQLFSTDGIQHLPADLKPNLIGYTEENQPKVYGRLPDPSYDCQISYTAMKNFPFLLANGKKNRFGIFCYEWAGKNSLPTGFARHYQSCDMLCPPSQFAKQVFLDGGIPDDRMKVIPHGIYREQYEQNTTMPLPTKKSCILLSVLGQLHKRKGIPTLLEAYGKAFTSKDDVCLILKAKDKPVKFQFDVSLKDCLKDFYRKFPDHAELVVYDGFVEDISKLYRSCSALYSLSENECFLMPALESIASGKCVIASGYGGQLDFLNASNSLLVEGKEVRADPRSMYWEAKQNAVAFKPDLDDAISKLRFLKGNFRTLNAALDKQRADVYAIYDWQNIMRQFLELCG